MSARVAWKSRRDLPAYPVAEAALYVRIAPATLRSWTVGRPYETTHGIRRFQPLIRLADQRLRLLSFNNLIEAHILRALRTTHGAPIRSIRTALRYAESELGVERLLLSRELCTDKRDLFLDRYGELINQSRSGQMAMRAVLESHLKRIEWDAHAFPMRLYPFVRTESAESPSHVAIDPDIGFGRPIILRRGISTRVIVDRIDAGESAEAVAEDYALSLSEIEEAVVYERAAQRVAEIVYFTDRNLGQQFPNILVAAGIAVERHLAHFADDAPDEEWIAGVAARGWVAVSHDKRISRRPNERQAVIDARLALLIVVGAVPFAQLAENFVTTRARIDAFVRRHTPPFIARIYRPTPAELTRKRNPVGRVEYWLP